MIHYALIEGVNDSDLELVKLLMYGQQYGIPLKMLKFNPKKGMERSWRESLWIETLTSLYPARFVYYAPPGANIGASCGQFTKHYYLDPTAQDAEFEAWKKKYEVPL